MKYLLLGLGFISVCVIVNVVSIHYGYFLVERNLLPASTGGVLLTVTIVPPGTDTSGGDTGNTSTGGAPISNSGGSNTTVTTNFSIADINRDGKVNLIDASILAYWFKRPLSAVAKLTADLNLDGKVDLTDFSIFAYYWNR